MSLNDSESIKEEINNKLKYYRKQISNFHNDDSKVMAKCESTRNIDDYSKSLAKQCNVLKAMDELNEKLTKLCSQVDKYQLQIQQANKKIDKLKQGEEEEVEKKLESTMRRSNEIDRIYDFLGFQVELKQEDVYTVHFTKLPIKDPEMKFKFEILENNDKIKVLRCEPPTCIETTELEKQLDLEQEANNVKFLKLILQIRQQLINKYRN